VTGTIVKTTSSACLIVVFDVQSIHFGSKDQYSHRAADQKYSCSSNEIQCWFGKWMSVHTESSNSELHGVLHFMGRTVIVVLDGHEYRDGQQQDLDD
jgi:hypothetical protein